MPILSCSYSLLKYKNIYNLPCKKHLLQTCCIYHQVAEEDTGSAVANSMAEEPYFVDFLRDPPEPTGTHIIVSSVCFSCQWFLRSP